MLNVGLRRLRVTWGPGGQKAVSGTGTVIHGAGCLTYSMAVETSGSAAAEMSLFDGNANNGELLTTYTLSAGQSTSESNGPHWVAFERGIYVVTTSGAIQGAVTVYVDHVCNEWLRLEHLAVLGSVAVDERTLSG
jgi:hypothetical protein